MWIRIHWVGRTCRRSAVIAICGLSALLVACSDDAGKVTDHLANARSYILNDNPRAAILELKSALQLDVQNISARLMLGRAYLHQGLGKVALKELRSAQELGSQDADLSVDIARALVAAGEFDDALKAIEAGGNDSARWKTASGFAHLGKQQHDLAQSAFKRAIELDDNNTEARRGLAQAGFARGDKELAKRQIETALRHNARDVQAWLLKGELELSLLELPAAQGSFEQVLAFSADSVSGRIGLVRTLLAQKNIDESSKHLRALERLNLNDPMINYLRALEARQKNDIKTAQQALREVLSVAPNHAPSQLLMGQIMLLQRELDQAKTMLERYVAQVPNNPSGRKLLAAVLLELDDAPGAVDTLKPLEQAMPDDSQLLSLLGTAYLKLRNFDKGQMYMQRASKQSPRAPAIRTQLAVSHLAKGDNETAATELQAVIEQNPDFERADFLLVLTYLRAGELNAALSTAQALVDKQAENAQAHNLLGAVFETRKDTDAARAAYQRSMELAPDGRAGILNIARMDLLGGNITQAQQGFQRVLDQHAGDPTALLGLAKIASDAGEFEKSLELLELARSENAKALRPRLVLASYYLRQRMADKALKAAAEAIAIAPQAPAVRVILGRAQLAAQHGADAIQTFSSLANEFPDNANVHFNLALALHAQRRLDSARNALQRTLELQPAFHAARAALGQLQLLAGNHAEALTIADRLAADIPDAAAANSLRGDIYSATQKQEHAIDAYALAFKAAPSSAALSKLLFAKQRAGQVKQAREQAQDWLAKHPEDSVVRSLLATSSHESGNADQAVTNYEKVLEQNPNNVLVLNNLAWLYDARGDARSLDLAKRAYELLPARAEIADTYGWLLVKSGEIEQGLRLLDRAIIAAPGNGDIRYHHAAALLLSGESKRATDLLTKLLKEQAEFSERNAAERLLKLHVKG